MNRTQQVFRPLALEYRRIRIRFSESVTLATALDTVAMRLLSLAIDGRWAEANQESGADEALAMLRTFLYGDIVPWLPESVLSELAAHGSRDLVEETESFIDVHLMRLEVTSSKTVEDCVARWAGRIASVDDSQWLAEAWHVEFMDAAVTFDKKLVRGVSGEVEGLPVITPTTLWDRLGVPRGSQPRKEPSQDNPLYAIEGWRWL